MVFNFFKVAASGNVITQGPEKTNLMLPEKSPKANK